MFNIDNNLRFTDEVQYRLQLHLVAQSEVVPLRMLSHPMEQNNGCRLTSKCSFDDTILVFLRESLQRKRNEIV